MNSWPAHVVTAGNLFCGLSSILLAMSGRVEAAAWLIVCAVVLDALDGKTARLLGAASTFGMHFDSLADLASFGVAPAVLVYSVAFSAYPIPGLLITFIPMLCVAVRLARFNASADGSERDFIGLSAPLHAALAASFVIMNYAVWERVTDPAVLGVLVLLTSALMVSRLPLPRLPRFTLREPGFNLAKIAFLVAAFGFAAANPARHLFFVLALVVILGFAAGSVRVLILRGHDLSTGGGAATIYGGER